MRIALILAAWLSLTVPAFAGCRLALVLATDVSSSIDGDEYRLQMDGIARAFRTPLLRDAMLAVPGAHVTVTVVHWSGYKHQEQVVPWTVLSDEAAIAGFADATAAAPRRFDDRPTAVAKGLQFSAELLKDAPCDRKIIDLTGDGVSNIGIEPIYFARRGLFDGLVINGLAIRGAEPDPEPYYRENVARGAGSFVMAIEDYRDYPAAILQKLLREIAVQYTMRVNSGD